MEETIKLGGSIELSGFSNLDGGQMIVLKKIVGNYARKMEEKYEALYKNNVTVALAHFSTGMEAVAIGATAALRKAKMIFDPNNILNPGKLCF